MLTGDDRARFRRNLLQWFAQFQRDLPWRRNKDAYRIWLSEIMLQQTRVAAAIPYYERFLKHFPTIEALAAAPQGEVLRLWSGLGYYSRARNLQKAAQQIVGIHGAEFPRTREEALALPGIGAYTVAAILSIAHGERLAVLDGNVARVLARLLGIRGDLRTTKTWRELQQTADALLDPETPGDWNQAMMELGATLCTPRSPQCLLCPVAEFCEARKQRLTEVIPEKRKKRDVVDVTMAAIVFLDGQGRTLLLPPPQPGAKQRTHHHVADLISRMWHFPTIEIEGAVGHGSRPAKTRTGKQAPVDKQLRKWIAAEFFAGKSVTGELKPLRRVRHAVTFRRIVVLPFALQVARLPKVRGSKAIALAEVSELAVSNLTRKVARAAEPLTRHAIRSAMHC